MKAEISNKVLNLNSLVDVVQQQKTKGKTIALCHGVFDLVHPGHVRHLSAASQQADILVVTVTADRFVNKGPGRPVYDERLRTETLAALECVDYVSINEASSAVNVINALAPCVFVKGSDYANQEEDVTGMVACTFTQLSNIQILLCLNCQLLDHQ
mgnify:CR=1 FL=1